MSHLHSLEMFIIFMEALGRSFSTHAWDITMKRILRVDLVVMGAPGDASCLLYILVVSWREGKWCCLPVTLNRELLHRPVKWTEQQYQ